MRKGWTYQHKCKKWEKDEDGPEEVTPAKNSALEELSRDISQYWKCKEQNVEAEPNLERSMTIHQGREKLLIPYHTLYHKKASTVQTTLDKFFYKEIAHFNSQCF